MTTDRGPGVLWAARAKRFGYVLLESCADGGAGSIVPAQARGLVKTLLGLFERLEIGHNFGGLVVREPDIRHRRARLQGGRIRDPLLQIVRASIADGTTRDLGSTGQAGEIRADRTGRPGDARDG